MRLLLLGFFLLPLTDFIAPGDPRLQASRISTGSDTLAVLVTGQGDPQLAGMLALRTLVTTGEAPSIVRTESALMPDGSWDAVDTFTLDATTLAPPGADVFYGNSMDLLLASLPLERGFEARVMLSSPDGASLPADVRVTAREDIRVARSPVECAAWRVDVAHDGKETTYWIARESRVLARFVSLSENLLVARIAAC